QIGETWGDVLNAVSQGPVMDTGNGADSPEFPALEFSFVPRLRHAVAYYSTVYANAGQGHEGEPTPIVTEELYEGPHGVTVSRVGEAGGRLEPDRHTYLIPPGLSGTGGRYQALAEEIAEAEPTANVLLVDWSPLAPLFYRIEGSLQIGALVGAMGVQGAAND